MKYEKGTFCQVINLPYIAGLDPMVQTVWVWLCKFADKDGKCFPSLTKLMEVTGIKSNKTIISKIKVLEEKGLIVKSKVPSSGKKYLRNQYQLFIKLSNNEGEQNVNSKDFKGTEIHTVGKKLDKNDKNYVSEVHTNYNSIYNNNIYTIASTSSLDEKDKNIGKEVNKALTLWNDYNPEIGYGNKSQRKAVEDMVKDIGFEKYMKMSKLVISFQGKEFAPSVTSPYEMKVKKIKINQYLDRTEA